MDEGKSVAFGVKFIKFYTKIAMPPFGGNSNPIPL